jgi:RNA polymerase sigma-70 factor (ECF subfamily)
MLKIDLTDPACFARAYRDHRARAFSIANRVLRDPAAAEDVVQDVFAEIWSRPRAFDARRGSLSTYIGVLARCRAIDQQRSRKAREAALARAAAAEPPPDPHESPAETTIRADERGRTLRALDELPAEQRDAVLLNFGGGLTVPEIARVTGIPLGTAKSRVRLGLRKSRTLLEAA